MMRYAALGLFGGLLIASMACAGQAADSVELGRLANGATVAFVKADSGDWGIDISGSDAPRFSQPKPAAIEVFADGQNARSLVSGYQTVTKDGDAVVATAKVTGNGTAAFSVEDRWTVAGTVLSLSRKVSVTGAEDDAGFLSAIRLTTAPTVTWEDATYFVPGLLYGDSSHAGGGSPTSAANDRAKRFSVREDYLAAPVLGVWLRDGNWAAVLDSAPRGDTTQAEITASAATPIIDERLQFGALGAAEVSERGIELSFCLPGTTTEAGGGGGRRGGARAGATPADTAPAAVRRRYHPVKVGFAQTYRVAFRFDKTEAFRDMQRDAWRWAWDGLAPKATPVDVEVMRTALMDHLADRIETVDDRAGIPYQANTISGRSNSTKIQMSFCGKNIEAADQLLIEGDRDKSERGQRMRKLGLAIIDSFIRIVPMSPPGGSGFDMRTGQAITGNTGSMYLRAGSEDMPFLLDAYQREKMAGNDHPEWLEWVTSLADWLVQQQREDGSWPQIWQTGTTTVRGTSGATTYAPVPMLVKLSTVTGEKKYLDAATKAADYLWAEYGSQCVYCGATGNANIADKESGMLSVEAFLAVYDGTKDPKWLDRAESAASYTESWIWIWNVPMPIGANDATLHWKRGVPTIGVNGIGSDVAGHVDQFLDWSAPSYAKLYKLTNDEHYLDVARVLLHGTKAMLALPGRTYDMLGPGWQQEHWRMGPGTRGMGAHRDWLPWISVNHIHGIIGLEQLDPDLYRQLSTGK